MEQYLIQENQNQTDLCEARAKFLLRSDQACLLPAASLGTKCSRRIAWRRVQKKPVPCWMVLGVPNKTESPICCSQFGDSGAGGRETDGQGRHCRQNRQALCNVPWLRSTVSFVFLDWFREEPNRESRLQDWFPQTTT